jgi:Caspase domain
MRKHVLAAVALAIGLLMLPVAADSALAEKRVALVIGNGAYQHVAKLANPIKDGTAMADMFRKAGFDWVKLTQDVGNLDFKRALREFMDAATDSDIAVVYYAGHGIQIRDMNYMIPVDARLATEIDAEDEAVSLDRIVMALEPAKRLRLVILDACRDNPFMRNMKRRVSTRALNGGLAKMEPTLGDTLIAYAAKAGSTADDGEGAHSPFAAALVKHLAVPGLDIRLAFGRVRDEVLKATAYKQEPFVYGSLGGESIALVPAPVKPQAPAMSEQKGDYQLVERIGTKKAWEVFLSTHKEGMYADLARAQLQKLVDAEQQAVATPATKPGEEQRITLAAVEPTQPPKTPEPSGEERRAWTRVDKDNPGRLRDFIERYPASPLAEQAKNRLDLLDRAARERDEKARAEREAKTAEAARRTAEREAIKQREAEERQAKAEAERLQAQREAAIRREAEERQAQLRREAEERRTKATADAERQKAEREAAQRREAEQKQAALRREAEERQAKAAADGERARQEREAARAERELAQRHEAERQAALQRESEDRQAKTSVESDPVCQREADRLTTLQASISLGWARADIRQLQDDTTCEGVRARATALLRAPAGETGQSRTVPPHAPAAAVEQTNTPDLIRAAQNELQRLGCFSGSQDGKLSGTTKAAIGRFLTEKGRPSSDGNVTETFVASLREQQDRVCALTCARGQHPEGDRCVADAKPEPKEKPKATVRQRDEDDEPRSRTKPRREEPKREAAKPRREEPKREAARPQPAARSQAAAPSRPSGMVGVGF